jgi:hypothetical protein
MEGLTDDDVAEITGLRSGTVRVRLHRARLFVRKELMKAGRRLPERDVRSGALRTPKKLSRAVSLYGKYSTQKKFQEMQQHAA